ncbi:MAG TPA: phospholipase D family protein [Allosphingosinicella sp.]|jgi:phosphatidylserine/phosphatidylglycerophosphate/cardiolipin synthase-like enzyme
MTEADPLFLDKRNSMAAVAEDADWTLPSPPRDGCKVAPLIEAADMYPALEHLVLDAAWSVWLSFRVFDPETKTRSDRAKALGLDDWAALIRHAVERGIEVRILLADFEPVLADYLHAGSWHTYQVIRRLVEALPKDRRDRLQLIVIQHEGEMGWGWRHVLRLLLRRRIRKVVEKLVGREHHHDGGFETRPGLWRHVDWDGDTARGWKPAPPPRLWPATYHQKFVVVDGESAIIGGLDLDERRWDDRRHRQRANETWHDISALIEGPVVADAGRHFMRLWNRELPRYRETVEHWTGGSERALMLDPLTEISWREIPPQPPRGEAEVQLARTLSRKSRSPFAIGPVPGIRELKAAHRNVILSARRLLYIEAQFFRSKAAADWVEAALRANPQLEVIILIANTPEEIAFDGQTDNLAHRHGEHLQVRALARLMRKAGPSRVGLFTLAKREPVKASEQKFEETRGTAYGSGLIHIHAKLLIADDEVCLLSSANINGRSFDWDTELGFIWRQRDGAIGEFRRKLWWQLFGGSLPETLDLEGWRDVARHNSAAEPRDRQGFVVPYQLGRARRFARPYWFIPDDLV